jgi:hypothetical protein
MRKSFNTSRKLKGTKESKGMLSSALVRELDSLTYKDGTKLKVSLHPKTAHALKIPKQTDDVLNSVANQFQRYSIDDGNFIP